ncbi:hypothetical protein PSY52_23275, partial [Shigella flexneri]|nr:hypothetical protein [Shigella flexneri]
CAEIITPHEKIGKGIPDNWDKLNNKTLSVLLLLSLSQLSGIPFPIFSCAEIITPHEKIGKGIPDNWDKLNNKT